MSLHPVLAPPACMLIDIAHVLVRALTFLLLGPLCLVPRFQLTSTVTRVASVGSASCSSQVARCTGFHCTLAMTPHFSVNHWLLSGSTPSIVDATATASTT